MIKKIKAFFTPKNHITFIRSMLLKKADSKCPQRTLIEGKSIWEHFTELEGNYLFWYNDGNKSTGVVSFKSLKWYIFLLKGKLL